MSKMKLPKSFLAPIFGYTNAPFRLLCQKHGAEACFVPLIHVSRIVHGSKLIDVIPEEKNLGIQLSGSNPKHFADAVKIIEKKYHFIKRFDVNCGCPSNKAVECNLGSALMKKPKTIANIIKTMKKETDLQISVKTRIFKDKKETLNLAEAIEDAGTDFIIVHGRTPSQGYSGAANWEMIKEVNESISIPLVGNGDIRSAKEGKQKIKQGFCSSFMIGRAAMQNPMLFKDKIELDYGKRKKLFLEYVELCKDVDCLDISDLRIKSTQFFRNIPHSASLRNELFKSKIVEDLIAKLE
jgi:tRNA-dihydrouridine synthase B